MKICQFWGKKLISLSQKYEERVRKFSFFGRNHLKAELYRYIYITIFGKYLLMDCINGFLDPQCIVSQGDFQHETLVWSILLPSLVPKYK